MTKNKTKQTVSHISNCQFYYCLFMGDPKWGVRSGGTWTVPYSGPWTRSVGGSMDRGLVFSGHHRRRELDGVVYSTHPSIQ